MFKVTDDIQRNDQRTNGAYIRRRKLVVHNTQGEQQKVYVISELEGSHIRPWLLVSSQALFSSSPLPASGSLGGFNGSRLTDEVRIGGEIGRI